MVLNKEDLEIGFVENDNKEFVIEILVKSKEYEPDKIYGSIFITTPRQRFVLGENHISINDYYVDHVKVNAIIVSIPELYKDCEIEIFGNVYNIKELVK